MLDKHINLLCSYQKKEKIDQEIQQEKKHEVLQRKGKKAETSQCRSFTQNCDICYTREEKKKNRIIKRRKKIRILMKRIIRSEEHLTFSFCRET